MKRCLWVVLAWIMAGASAGASSVLPMFLDDLTAESQTVVHGRVVAARVEWDESRNWLYTIYTIAPSEYLKGQLGAVFELREPGGELNGVGMVVSGAPHFPVGQEVVLFVWTDPKGYHQATAFEQGVVRVERDATTGIRRASRAVPLGSARAAAVSISQPSTSLSLPLLLNQIRDSVARTRRERAAQ